MCCDTIFNFIDIQDMFIKINSGDVVKVRRKKDTAVLLTFSIHN